MAATREVVDAQRAEDQEVRRFIAALDIDPALAFDRFPDVLDRDDVRAAFAVSARSRGLTVADVLPETAQREIPDAGCWIQILDVSNVNRYGAQIGFEVEEGSVWYATEHADDNSLRIPVHLPYSGRQNKTRTLAFTIDLAVRMARIETPKGPVMLFPREYRILDAETMREAVDGAAFTALDLDGTGVPEEWLFYLRSRGIAMAEALVLLAHAVRSGRFGYFHPAPGFDRWEIGMGELFTKAGISERP